jgi:hypothetical protein
MEMAVARRAAVLTIKEYSIAIIVGQENSYGNV